MQPVQPSATQAHGITPSFAKATHAIRTTRRQAGWHGGYWTRCLCMIKLISHKQIKKNPPGSAKATHAIRAIRHRAWVE
eukprot:1161336-Pelagomonas_calceolata.AAC.5